MLHNNTIYEVKTNENPGVEYEIALFYKLLANHPEEAAKVKAAIDSRYDSWKID